MKLLFAIKALDDVKGGAERVLADVTSGLTERDHDISVLTFDRSGGQSFYPLNKKIRHICLGIGNTHHKATFLETLVRMKMLRRTVKEEKPDVVIPFMHSMFIPMAFALIGTGVPVIASEHIVPEHYKTRWKEAVLFFLSSFFVSKITVLSESVKKSYISFFHKKMVSIANPVHKPKILADPEGKNAARKIILNVGRLTDQKDQKILIRAFAKLAPDYPDWDVRIVGDGELRTELETLIKKMKLENRVFLPGTTPKIEQEYQRVHIFALPSKYESFGLATAEAMAHGLPAIGFQACPGTNELIINDENGFLVKGEDRLESFSASLKNMMDSPSLRVKLGNSARKSIEPFYPGIIIKKWNDLIKKSVITSHDRQNLSRKKP